MPQSNKRNMREKPTLAVLAASNDVSVAYISANAAMREPLAKTSSFNHVRTGGINGLGQEGRASIVNALDLHSIVAHSGEVIRVAEEIVTHQTVTFPDVDDPSLRYVAVYDSRVGNNLSGIEANKKPAGALKVFRQELRLDEDGGVVGVKKTSLLPEKRSLTISEKVIKKDELYSAAAFVFHAMAAGVKTDKSLADYLQSVNGEVTTYPDYAKMIKIFDHALDRTPDNLRLLSEVATNFKEESGGKIDTELLVSEGDYSTKYTMLHAFGLEIHTIEQARIARRVLEGDIKASEKLANSAELAALLEIQEYMKEKGMSAQIRNVDTTFVGYDETGSIIVYENHTLPMVPNMSIYNDVLGDYSKELRDDFGKLLARAGGKDGNAAPTDREIIEIEERVRDRVKYYARELYGEGSAGYRAAVVAMGEGNAQKILTGGDADRAHAIRVFRDTFTFLKRAAVRHVLAFSDDISIAVNDFMTRDGKRLRRYPYSFSTPFDGQENRIKPGVQYDNYLLNAKIPMLSYPVDSELDLTNINFKNTVAPVAKVARGKDGSVLDIIRLADPSRWRRVEGKMAGVMMELLEIDMRKQGAKERVDELLNYGKVGENGKADGNGILGVLSTNELIKERLFDTLSTIYNTFTSKGVNEGRKAIRALEHSHENNEKNLWNYIEASATATPRIVGLEAMYRALGKPEAVEAIKDLLNGEINAEGLSQYGELSDRDIMGVKVAAVIIEADFASIDSAVERDMEVNPLIDGSPAIVSAAETIGRRVVETTSLQLLYKGKGGSVGFAVSSNWALPFEDNPFVSYSGADNNYDAEVDIAALKEMSERPGGEKYLSAASFIQKRFIEEQKEKALSKDEAAALNMAHGMFDEGSLNAAPLSMNTFEGESGGEHPDKGEQPHEEITHPSDNNPSSDVGSATMEASKEEEVEDENVPTVQISIDDLELDLGEKEKESPQDTKEVAREESAPQESKEVEPDTVEEEPVNASEEKEDTLLDRRAEIASKYGELSLEEKEEYADALDSIFQERAELVARKLGYKLHEWKPLVESGVVRFDFNKEKTNVIGAQFFGVLDDLSRSVDDLARAINHVNGEEAASQKKGRGKEKSAAPVEEVTMDAINGIEIDGEEIGVNAEELASRKKSRGKEKSAAPVEEVTMDAIKGVMIDGEEINDVQDAQEYIQSFYGYDERNVPDDGGYDRFVVEILFENKERGVEVSQSFNIDAGMLYGDIDPFREPITMGMESFRKTIVPEDGGAILVGVVEDNVIRGIELNPDNSRNIHFDDSDEVAQRKYDALILSGLVVEEEEVEEPESAEEGTLEDKEEGEVDRENKEEEQDELPKIEEGEDLTMDTSGGVPEIGYISEEKESPSEHHSPSLFDIFYNEEENNATDTAVVDPGKQSAIDAKEEEENNPNEKETVTEREDEDIADETADNDVLAAVSAVQNAGDLDENEGDEEDLCIFDDEEIYSISSSSVTATNRRLSKEKEQERGKEKPIRNFEF